MTVQPSPSVLLVDDYPANLKVLPLLLRPIAQVETLDHLGMKVEEVIRAIRLSQAILAIVDGQYQDGTAVDLLRGLQGSKEVVVLSANPTVLAEVRRFYPEVPVVERGTKYDIEDLMGIVNQHCTSHSPQA